MAFVFPSEEDLDNICKQNSVPEGPFRTDSPLTLRLPNFVTLLLAVEQNSVLALAKARGKLKPVDKTDFEALKKFIETKCGIHAGWSLFKSVKSGKFDSGPMPDDWYILFLDANQRFFGNKLEDFEKVLKANGLAVNEKQALGTALVDFLKSEVLAEVYKEPLDVQRAYNNLKSLPGYWERLIESAEAICGKLEELEKSDAKLAATIQKELNDKLQELYKADKDSVSLNDVAAVLTDIKFLPELDPLLNKTVE